MNLTLRALERAWSATCNSAQPAGKSLAKYAYIPGDCPQLKRIKTQGLSLGNTPTNLGTVPEFSKAKLSITVERSDGGIVDAEIIRPRSWILASGLCAALVLPLNLPELEVSGLALVNSIDDCPPIAGHVRIHVSPGFGVGALRIKSGDSDP